MIDVNAWKNHLMDAFEYAKNNKTFTKVDIVQNAKNVCVFGLGKYFEDAFERQNIQERFRVKYLCDNNHERMLQLRQSGKYDADFIEPNDLSRLESVVVIIMLGDPRSALLQLSEIIGRERCVTFNDLILDDLMSEHQSEMYYYAQRDKMLKVYDMLADDLSKYIYANIICLRIAPHLAEAEYEELYSAPQYFPNDIISLSEEEHIVDCGAYTGDTLDEFLKIAKKFEKYYAFELDKDNYDKLKTKSQQIDENSIRCYHLGVWKETKNITYGKMSASDSYSIYNNSECEESKVVALDEQLANQRVTFIKMDIEGAEMSALQGAEQIISTQKPQMAVCIYHRIDDMWNVPLYLVGLNSAYKFFVRHHAKWWVSETVCYAINE